MQNIIDSIVGLRDADLQKVRLGRYPFRAGIKYYDARFRAYLSPYTLDKDLRALRAFGKILAFLKQRGLVKNTDPRHMKKVDVEGFLIWMRERGLKPSTRDRYLKTLKKYLGMFGNDIIDDMGKENPGLLPPIPPGEIKAFTLEEMNTIIRCIRSTPGWRGAALLGFTALAFGTGCRPKEVRLAHLEDLDMAKGRFFVRHPKGEESYGVRCSIPIIRGDMAPLIKEYLSERERILAANGMDSKYYIPNPKTGLPYTTNGIGVMYRTLSTETGFPVRSKDFRPTLASLTIAGDLSRLKATGLQLRHRNLSTTERYYAQIYPDAIEQEIGDVWERNPVDSDE